MKATILELAERRARAAELITQLGAFNSPTDCEARIAADARYSLALEAHRRADQDYRFALTGFTIEELLKLAEEQPK